MAESLDSYSDIEEDDNDSLTELFNKSANHVKTLASNLEAPKLLELYSHYKQALEGKCNTSRPRFYELQAKAKWDAWNSLGNMPQIEAKQKYIKLVSDLDPDFDESKQTSNWVAVSCLANMDENIDDSDKTIFDHVKESDLANLNIKLKDNLELLNETDGDGMGLIHWAADRGDVNILKHLINLNVNINMLDADGQTALHYAASCDHLDCVKLLVDRGVDVHIKDADGVLAKDLTTDEEIIQLLSN